MTMWKNIGVAGLLVSMVAAAWAATGYYQVFRERALFLEAVEFDSGVTFDGAVALTEAAITGEVQLPATAVSLTSPTTTFSAAGKSVVVLATDANLTGVYPTGGSLNQVLIIRTAAGSNTARLDDGTSMTIGANITLTEGQNDAAALLCVSSDGDEWMRLFSADN